MYLSPEMFIEKYRKEELPFFKIFKGNSTQENQVIARFLENPEELPDNQLMEMGAAQLEEFFEMFPDGNVNIITKNHPKVKNATCNSVNVRWGNAANGGGGGRNLSVNGHGGGGNRAVSQMKEMQSMFAFFGDIFKSQMEAQSKVLESNYRHQIEMMKRDQEHKEQIEELMAQYAEPEPTIGQVALQEMVGMVKPAMEFFLTKQGVRLPSSDMPPLSVNGMAKELEESEVETTEETPQKPPHSPQNNPMYGASLDQIIILVRQLAENVFPEYNVNESLPALVAKCIEQKALIRSQVEPIILSNRQAKKSSK